MARQPASTAKSPLSSTVDDNVEQAGYLEDTIVALATPPGRGGIAVIRLSGENSLGLAEAICSAPLAEKPRHSFFTQLISPVDGEDVDQAIVTYFQKPTSFTGEDMVEISTHGGSVSPNRVIRLLLRLGARHALPGEFTQRAFLNGKLDLAEAESLNQVIGSLSRRSQSAALQNLEGRLSKEIASIRQNMLNLLAVLEHELDFSEDEIEHSTQTEIAKQLARVRERLQRLKDTIPYGRVIREGVRVVITGRTNAGKSSLFNALVGQEKALVTQIPGTTRDSLEAWVEMDGFPVCLIDTAGLRDSTDALEKLSMERSRLQLQTADIVLLLDPEDPHSFADEISLTRYKTVLYVKSKVDILEKVEANGAITVSVKRTDGLDQVTAALLDTLERLAPDENGSIVTSVRQADGLEKALSQLDRVKILLVQGHGMDIISEELRHAIELLAEIIGETTDEDVLLEIFREFCVGK
ncbi:MAG: tRNA uridine-5-carboxymethylaminomethyl(34) synthesis GTPase MnmE [Candidatus Neomarinimicrobiota bacterium]